MQLNRPEYCSGLQGVYDSPGNRVWEHILLLSLSIISFLRRL